MDIRTLSILGATAASLFIAAPTFAQQQEQKQPGVSSGPAAGTNVAPSSATQKQDEGRSSGAQPAAPAAAGAPAQPGAEGGPAPQKDMK
jgi:hypothetical protein